MMTIRKLTKFKYYKQILLIFLADAFFLFTSFILEQKKNNRIFWVGKKEN